MLRRSLLAAAGLLAAALVGVGSAGAVASAEPDPSAGHALGFLLVTEKGEPAVALPPGQAKRVVTAACGVALDVDAVRAAFPAAVEVCPGVAVASQVAAEPTPTPTPVPVA